MRTSKFVAGTSRAIGAMVSMASMASKENPAGNESGRQEIDDLPEWTSQKLTITSKIGQR